MLVILEKLFLLINKPTDEPMRFRRNIKPVSSNRLTLYGCLGVSNLLTNIKLKILGGINYV